LPTFLTPASFALPPWTDLVYCAGQDREIEGMRLAGILE